MASCKHDENMDASNRTTKSLKLVRSLVERCSKRPSTSVFVLLSICFQYFYNVSRYLSSPTTEFVRKMGILFVANVINIYEENVFGLAASSMDGNSVMSGKTKSTRESESSTRERWMESEE